MRSSGHSGGFHFFGEKEMTENYIELIESVGKDVFQSRFIELQKQINEFLVTAGYIPSAAEVGCAECNDRILYHVLLDYYSDIQRLKPFHGIEYPKPDKNIAYLSYWILRRKPIQIDNSVEKDKDIFINERFVCYMITYECLQQKQKNSSSLKLDQPSAEAYSKYIDLLLYFLKYRECNAQMLELLIETFKIGIVFGEIT